MYVHCLVANVQLTGKIVRSVIKVLYMVSLFLYSSVCKEIFCMGMPISLVAQLEE